MKKSISSIAVTICMCLIFSSCSFLPDNFVKTNPNDNKADERQVYSNSVMDFSFLYDPDMTVEEKDSAVVVYVEGDGESPYIRLFFTPIGEVAFSLENYLHFVVEDLRAVHGDKLLEAGEKQNFDMAGKTLTGIRCALDDPDGNIYMWFLADESDTYVVQYECVCSEGGGDSVMDTLEYTVETLRPDADYYASGTHQPDASGTNNQTTDVGKPTKSAPSKLGAYSVTKNTPLQLQTALYNGGFFSLTLPTGWVIETTGEYTLFGFHAFDPNIPERQVFFYCKHHPLLKNMDAKNYYERAAQAVGSYDLYGYHQWADTPVLLEPTTEYFFYIYNDYNNFLNKYGLNHQLPIMNDISILETYPNDTPTAFNTLDNSIVRASFNSANGVACEGLMAGQVANYGTDTYSVPGADMGTYAVYNCNGVIAPAGEFNELHEHLMSCLASFTFTEDYVKQTQQHVAEETSSILAMSRQMQAAYDSYNAAWSARQTSYDIISQKNSDATLGYDRLYDPYTGEIYRAEQGFYDAYDINRDQYSNPNLQIIDGSTENYYLDGVDYYITK